MSRLGRVTAALVLAGLAGCAGAERSGAQTPPAEALATGRYADAERGFAAELARDPASWPAARGLAQALAATGQDRRAIEALQRFAEATGSAEPWRLLGELLLESGRLDEGRAALERARAGPESLTARLRLATLQERRGDRAQAMAEYRRVAEARPGRSARALAAVAEALQRLSAETPAAAHEALRVYDRAVAADSSDLDIQVALGRLFLEKYEGGEASSTFQAALRRNPRHCGALLGAARTKLFGGEPGAAEDVARCLAVNPRSVEGLVLQARLALEAEDYAGARAALDGALAVNPASLEALAALAAVADLRGDQAAYRESRRRAAAIAPASELPLVTLAEASARNRLYGRAEAFADSALALAPRAWRAWAVRGINRLRLGAMAEGRSDLETAFRGDPFDLWTKNTLDLLDVLARYPETATRRFRLVSDSAEAELHGIYAADLAERTYDRLAQRYRFRPAVPIRVELYRRHADFSVRTTGLVGLGALGVSFGPVIAMDAPSARAPGELHWASTLVHELAHTFHLGMTAHRVPRWVSEGLAVYEERRAGPGWGDGVTPSFLRAFHERRLAPVSDLNRGFTRPSYPEQVAHSYFQASLVFELIDSVHGFGAILKLLEGYRAGEGTPALLRKVLATSPEAFDDTVDRWIARRYAEPLAAIARGEDLGAALREGAELARQGGARDADALAALERAVALFPEYTGPGSPYWYLGQVYRRRGDLRRAERALATLTAGTAQHYEAQLALADVRLDLGDSTGAADALEQALYVHPMDPAVHLRLAELAGALGQPVRAVRERRAVLALAPVDRAEAYYRLAEAELAAGNAAEARRAVLAALEVAPGFERAQALLLRLRARTTR